MGAVEILTRTINVNAEKNSVCKNGISALKVLITKGIFSHQFIFCWNKTMLIDDNHKSALDSGVIEASAKAIHAQQKDPEVCRMGCQIIWSILMKGKRYAIQLIVSNISFYRQ